MIVVEHYQIAACGTVRSFAEQLGLRKVFTRLQMILEEKAATDRKLTRLAMIVKHEALASDGLAVVNIR